MFPVADFHTVYIRALATAPTWLDWIQCLEGTQFADGFADHLAVGKPKQFNQKRVSVINSSRLGVKN